MSEINFQLVIRKGPQIGQVFHLDAPSLIIGRDPMSDIPIGDPEMSRQHARLTQIGDSYQIEDLGSTNGTFVNGQRLASEPFLLQPGQVINMGSGVRLTYEIAGTPDMDVHATWDSNSGWPDAPDTPEPAADVRRSYEPPSEHDFAPPYHPVAPEPYRYDPPEPPPLVPSHAGGGRNRRSITIVVIAILLLCCCCTSLGFMYQWGGDWLLQYLGLF